MVRLLSKEITVAKQALNIYTRVKRPRGRPKKQRLDNIKENMRIVGVGFEDAQERKVWRATIKAVVPVSTKDTLKSRRFFRHFLKYPEERLPLVKNKVFLSRM